MHKPPIYNQQEENDIKKITDLFLKNYKLFVITVAVALVAAYMVNHFTTPIYKISSSLLIREDSKSSSNGNMNAFLNSGMFKMNQNFQNELWILKSTPVLVSMMQNLDLYVNYYKKEGLLFKDGYDQMPFRVAILQDHVQPLAVRFHIIIRNDSTFLLKAEGKNVKIQKVNANESERTIEKWSFEKTSKFGQLIETSDMAFVIQKVADNSVEDHAKYSFRFSNLPYLAESLRKKMEFNIVQKDATVVELTIKSTSVPKGKNTLDELMDVYAQRNLDQKNHTANLTIEYIEKQLGEISDSLTKTEENLQSFRSSKQLLNVTEQATGISTQYRDLQNQLAEVITRKRYYDYVSDYLASNNEFSDMIVPASMGIQDQLLNSLMSELITAQAQRNTLIQNNQEKNPLVQKLNIQINNLHKTIIDNITAVRKTTDISIDEMQKRIHKIEAEMSKMPQTQRQLGGIERKFKLNDAIYNYLMEKRAEAQITQASNLPDVSVVEPAKMMGSVPVTPNKILNYIIAFFAGLVLPLVYLLTKSAVSNKIESQEEFERLGQVPVLGKIMHNTKKTGNVMFEYPKSSIAESFRALRTNIEYQFKDRPHKTIFISSSIEGEGKSFTALNLAMSFAYLNRSTVLVDFDLRKSSGYFSEKELSPVGTSSFLNNKVSLDEIILKSPHEKLDYIPSGPIPPNPMELLTLDKCRELIDSLKERYDYVILDTTPLAQVSDAYLIMDQVDVKLIVTRFNYTLKNVFSFVMKDMKQKKVEDVFIIINDNRYYRDQYGYGYGYENRKK